MKVLLTGASGFIGRHVLHALQARGIDTVVAARQPEMLPYRIETIKADLLHATDFTALTAQANATHLLHLAWYAEHGKYWNSPINLQWVDTTVRLAEAFCQTGGQKVVMAGTCAEYDWSYGYCHEASTPPNPHTLYGSAKDACRRLVSAICREHGIPIAWGRIFFPFGPGEHPQRLIPSLIRVLRGEAAPFGINASAYRDLLAASDTAEAFISLLQADAEGVFNICSGEPRQLGQVLRDLARLLNGDPSPILHLASSRPGEPHLLAGDNSRLCQLGWRPRLSFHQALQQLTQPSADTRNQFSSDKGATQ